VHLNLNINKKKIRRTGLVFTFLVHLVKTKGTKKVIKGKLHIKMNFFFIKFRAAMRVLCVTRYGL